MTTTNMFLNFGGKWDSPPYKGMYLALAHRVTQIRAFVTRKLAFPFLDSETSIPQSLKYFLQVSQVFIPSVAVDYHVVQVGCCI